MSAKSSSSQLDYLFFYSLMIFAAASAVICQFSDQESIGICNGRNGNNLPSEKEVVELYKSNKIKRMRVYWPFQETLKALQGSDIKVVVEVPNKDLQSLQSDATEWVKANILPYFPATKISSIAVGNEVDPRNPNTAGFAPFLLHAMENVYRALLQFRLQDQIKVSTATYSAVLKDPYPPSKASFIDPSFMGPIIRFLARTRNPLLVNVYPYFAYKMNPKDIPLSYALFTSPDVVVRDGKYGYQNLFDAMVDGMYSAVEKSGAAVEQSGGSQAAIAVSESGWPSGRGPHVAVSGGSVESIENANTYYQNLIGHVKKGTPKRPGQAIETYLFAMFDENNKTGDPTEQHFGLFYPNKQMKYNLK